MPEQPEPQLNFIDGVKPLLAEMLADEDPDGDINPMLLINKKNADRIEEVFLIELPELSCDDPMVKHVGVRRIYSSIVLLDPDETALISMAWMSKSRPGNEFPAPATDPDRQEVLLITHTTKGSAALGVPPLHSSYGARVHRDGLNPPRLGQWSKPEDTVLAGPLTDTLDFAFGGAANMPTELRSELLPDGTTDKDAVMKALVTFDEIVEKQLDLTITARLAEQRFANDHMNPN